jgi:hypothetical protein
MTESEIENAKLHRPRLRFVVVGGLLVAALALLFVAFAGIGLHLGAGASPSASLPPGGISRDRAVELARELGYADAPLVSAEAGKLGSVYNSNPQLGPGVPASSDTLVWAVTFRNTGVVCPPPAGPSSIPTCFPPVTCTNTFVLDYYTGAILGSSASCPPI